MNTRLQMKKKEMADEEKKAEEQEQQVSPVDISAMLKNMQSAMLESSNQIKNQLLGSSTEIKVQLEENLIKMNENVEQLKKQVEDVVETSRVFEKHMENKLEETSRLIEEQVNSQVQQLRDELDELRHKSRGLTSSEQVGRNAPHPEHSLTVPVHDQSVEITRLGKLKLPTFDGEVSWSNYKLQFETAAQENGCNNYQMATHLILSLRGAALNILENMPQEKRRSYTDLKATLERRYGHNHLQQVYLAQWKHRTQHSEETLQAFEAEVTRLIRLAYPDATEEFSQRLATQAFMDGIRDSDTQQAVRMGRHKSSSEALAHVLEFESVKKVTRVLPRVREVEISTTKTSDCDIVQRIERIERFLEKKDRDEQHTPKTCWKCGKRGHLQAQCRFQSTLKQQEN